MSEQKTDAALMVPGNKIDIIVDEKIKKKSSRNMNADTQTGQKQFAAFSSQDREHKNNFS